MSGRTQPFNNLVSTLSSILGQGDIDSDHIVPEDILEVMNQYDSNPIHWRHLIETWSIPGEPYTRTLIDNGNGRYNLLLLVWRPGCESKIHDHTKHCCMKILQGSLHETLYKWPDDELLKSGTVAPPTPKRSTLISINQVSYISST